MKVHLETKCISPANAHIYTQTYTHKHNPPSTRIPLSLETNLNLKKNKKTKTVPWCLTASYLYSKKNKKYWCHHSSCLFHYKHFGGAQHVVVSISTLACEQKHRYLKTNKQNISSEKLSLLFLWTTEVKGHLEGLKKVQRLEEVTRWELWPWAEALCFCVCVCVSTRLF